MSKEQDAGTNAQIESSIQEKNSEIVICHFVSGETENGRELLPLVQKDQPEDKEENAVVSENDDVEVIGRKALPIPSAFGNFGPQLRGRRR